MTKFSGKIIVLVMSAAVAGCGPYALNRAPAPLSSGPEAYSISGPAAAEDPAPWHAAFHDEKLDALIAEALGRNLDVRQAAARYKQAAALRAQADALALPAVDGRAEARKSRQDGTTQRTTAELGAALAWEVDLFNRLGAAAEAGKLREEAAAADIDAARLFLAADIAETWYAAVAQRLQLDLLRQQAETDKKLLELNELRFQKGVGTNVDVLQQQSQLAETQSFVPVIEAALRVYENRLDVLAGVAPDGADRTAAHENIPAPEALPPMGVPSDLLLNRPDLRALRLSLVAADADIAAAIADRLPRLTLTGSTVYARAAHFTGPVATVLGTLAQPLLDWGRRKAEVARNKALYEERLAAFTEAYIIAVGDVENALYQEDRQREYLRQLEERRRILQETVAQTQAQYTEGLNDYLPVLNALQALRAVERTQVRERQVLTSYRIQLHRALGGAVPERDE